MREIPIKQAKSILKRALKGTVNQRICLLTKKMDRSLTIEIGDGTLALIEQGYVDATRTYRLADGDTKHAVVAAFKREFPRSHQVYLSQVKED